MTLMQKVLCLDHPSSRAPHSAGARIRGTQAWREGGSAQPTFTCFLYQSLSGTAHLPRILG